MTSQLKIKRSYLPEEAEDGARILVDRLWPRGQSKAQADLYEWEKDLAPSTALRTAFHHGSIDFDTFKTRYLEELDHNSKARTFVGHVADLLLSGPVTLLYSSRDPHQNNAAVLLEWLSQRLEAQEPGHSEKTGSF